MLKNLLKSVGKKLMGDNHFLKRAVSRKYQNGHYLKAFFLELYLLPIRNILQGPHDCVKQYNFANSEAYYREIHQLMHIAQIQDIEMLLIGSQTGGGYVMIDDLPGGIAYSFGIGGDVSWDKDMAGRGYDVFMYDHTIDRLPENNPRFHWSKLGISDGMTHDGRLKSLEELIASNGHEGKHNMILKMDVEGAEWGR